MRNLYFVKGRERSATKSEREGARSGLGDGERLLRCKKEEEGEEVKSN